MATNGKWLSKDGQYYDTWLEKSSADSAWDKQREEQQQQNELIAEQNRLIQEQAEREQRKLEEMEFNNEIRMIRQHQHDEEMRVLGLFDSIGLNKQYYDDFIHYLFGEDEEDVTNHNRSIDLKSAQETNENILKSINKYLENPVIIPEELEYIFDSDKNLQQLKEEKDTFERYLDNPDNLKLHEKSIKILLNNKNYTECVQQQDKIFRRGWKFFALTFLVMFGGMPVIVDSDSGAFMVILIACILGILSIFFLLKGASKIKIEPFVKEEIKKINKKMEKSKNGDFLKRITNHKKEVESELAKIKDEQKNLNEYFDGVKIKWNDFVEFRKKHYNSQLEKLLLDVGLKEQLEEINIKYPKINNNNKTGDGTIEDYIAYFDSLTE